MVDILKRVKLLDACINRQGNLFDEIKKLRKSSPIGANAIDGISDDIPKHFADIYGILYNSVDDQVSLHRILRRVNCNISSISNEVTKVTPAIVCEAISHLKGNRSDPTFQFNCLLNAPAILYDHLACVFRSYLIHGHISNIIMLSTLIPLMKDKLADICASNNYRSIAISNLVLKILDWVIILLYGSKVELDELQFAYQPKCSTNMCTWMAVESIQYFLRNGSEVYTCVMAMTKAFDNVKYSILFEKLIHKGIPGIYVRLRLVMYDKQYANVKWNGSVSKRFTIRNGVKQGSVLSAILSCVYIDDLLKILRKKKSGCWIHNDFY